MNFYTFGEKDNPVILLLPGTCCEWKRNFSHVIPLLKEKFCVVCASYDGFDESVPGIFPDMITETEKIEEYIRKNFGGRICAAYGCSLGGSFVGLLIQRRRIRIDHGILGSSDLDQDGVIMARLKSVPVTAVLSKILKTGELPAFMKKRMAKMTPEQQVYITPMLKRFFGIGTGGLPFVNRKSVRNQYYSDLVTPLEEKISAEGTTVHVFYALKMGEQYRKRYLFHFRDPDIHEHDYEHEEFFLIHPEEWTQEVLSCCGM